MPNPSPLGLNIDWCIIPTHFFPSKWNTTGSTSLLGLGYGFLLNIFLKIWSFTLNILVKPSYKKRVFSLFFLSDYCPFLLHIVSQIRVVAQFSFAVILTRNCYKWFILCYLFTFKLYSIYLIMNFFIYLLFITDYCTPVSLPTSNSTCYLRAEMDFM